MWINNLQELATLELDVREKYLKDPETIPSNTKQWNSS